MVVCGFKFLNGAIARIVGYRSASSLKEEHNYL